jgi:SAM-dependent MidA family methyltransferase
MSGAPAPARTSPLAKQLAARIAREGPISVGDYMDACLHDPVHGYYRTRAAIGRAGDFITAPEISQVFGELIGLWCAVVWRLMGEPARLHLVELGPGRGTLMRDVLRAARTVPDFHRALEVELVESNATLAAIQRATLEAESARLSWSAELAARADAVPAILIANEFLDTLPVEQWVHRGSCWLQRRVGLDASGGLVFVEVEPDAGATSPPQVAAAAREGDVLETRAADFAPWSAKLVALGSPLAALFIDYGHAAPGFGDTLQAVRAHRYEDALAAPGEADLTAQVDFAAFAAAISDPGAEHGLACDGPVTQAEFLGALGIAERASRLMAANPARAAQIEGDVARLMAPGGMGGRFQAIGVRSYDVPPLPGLATMDSGASAP